MTLVFDKCCGCIDLRTGCLIIGYLNLIGDITLIVFDIIAVGTFGVVASGSLPDTWEKRDKITPEQRDAAYSLFVITIIILIFLFLFLAFTIVFLVGIHKEKRGHVKAYLIYASIFTVIYIISFLARFASPPIDVGKVFLDLFIIVLSIYFLLCIRSYYIKMGNSSMRPYTNNA